MKADQILSQGMIELLDRVASYDKQDGERSMARTVAMFNALTDQALSVEQGWLMMVCLKMVRSQQRTKKADNYVDGAALFALAGEEALLMGVGVDLAKEGAGKSVGTDWAKVEIKGEFVAEPIIEKVNAKYDWIDWVPNDQPPAELTPDELVDVMLRNGLVTTDKVRSLSWEDMPGGMEVSAIVKYRRTK